MTRSFFGAMAFRAVVFVGFCSAVAATAGDVAFKTKFFTLKVADGKITGMIDNATGKDYLAKDVPAPILQVRLFKDEGKIKNYAPSSMKWNAATKTIQLFYEDVGVETTIEIETKDSHVRMEVVDIRPREEVELVLWGPYPTTINRSIGECVGVVRGEDYAIGIQSLNAKTIGGSADSSNSQDRTHIRGVKDENEYDNIFRKVLDGHRMWGDTAWRAPFGSVLQAFCRDRAKQRYMDIWGATHVPRDIIKDGGPLGSKIALFGCPRDKALETIGEIEVAEGLPHAMLEGKWAKINPLAISTYLHVHYTVKNIDDYIAWAKTCPTIKAIYFATPGPVSDWGHFQHFRKWAFPNGAADFQKAVDKIKEAGFWVGIHTLSNFMTFEDAYVKNVDPRLRIIGHFKLDADIDADATEIPVSDPSKDLFIKKKDWGGNPWKNVVLMDREFVAYDKIADKPPYKLLGCVRGYFGTKKAPHAKGLESGQLYTECGYKITHGNGDMNMDMARNLAAFFNKYGVRLTALDGLEGNWSEGHGEYSRTRFMKEWYDHLRPELQNNTVSAASNAGHFLWHYITHFDWGDESLALRSSNTRYRDMNQSFYERNLLPKFMGGYKINPKTTLDEVEWFCAKAAAFDAGYAIQVDDPKGMLASPNNEILCRAMLEWQKVRESGAIPKEIKRIMQQPMAEFHLESIEDGKWKLYPRPDYRDRSKLGEPIVIPISKPLTQDEIDRFKPLVDKLPKVKAVNQGWGQLPKNIVDGDKRPQSFWGAAPYPQSATIDLEKPLELKGVRVYPQYKNPKSYYQYTVEVSADGENWTKVVDMSGNTTPATAKGNEFKFDSPRKARYIRVNMLYHNLDKKVELVEVEWF